MISDFGRDKCECTRKKHSFGAFTHNKDMVGGCHSGYPNQGPGQYRVLVNVQHDQDNRFELLGYRKKVVVRADLVEFVE